jgi:cyclophilin family peptidyl-prolyl cis-trans isomerase
MKININILLTFLFIIFFVSCNDNTKIAKNNISENIFKKDKILKQIYNDIQTQNRDDLIQLIRTKDTSYKKNIILGFCSLRDSNAAYILSSFLKNPNEKIRLAAAFSIGNLKTTYYHNRLRYAFKNETSDNVRRQILISLAQIGNTKDLKYICSLNIKKSKILEGQGLAFYYFAQRNIISTQMITKSIEIINSPKISAKTKLFFSYFLALDNKFDLSPYFKVIENEIKTNTNIFLLSNLTLSLRHCKAQQSIPLLRKILQSKNDYRIKISAIEALKDFDYKFIKNDFFKLVKNKNENIASETAKYFIINGKKADAQKYFNISKKVKSWQARSYLLQAALNYSDNKVQIEKSIISGYKVAENKYEKAALLYALSSDPSQYKFVMQQTFSAKDNIISTAGIKSLYAMRLNKNFNTIASKMKKKYGIDLKAEFRLIFKEAMLNGDNAMIYYSAKALNNKNLIKINEFTNTYFLSQAMNSLILPRDLKAYDQLCTSLNLYGGEKCSDNISINPLNINWKILSSIKPNQKVEVKTNKGQFIISLNVNQAPATVYTFLSLVEKNYYNNTYFFKDIAGKAIVNGGKRGDGWMNLNIPLISETSTKEFSQGAVAMSMNVDNFQSINWFVAKSPVAKYNGKYTIFGYVTEGLNTIQKLHVGDKIIQIRIL